MYTTAVGRAILDRAKTNIRNTFNNWKIVKGDQVKVMEGKFKGTVSTVIKVNRKRNLVFLDGVNLQKKAMNGITQQYIDYHQLHQKLHAEAKTTAKQVTKENFNGGKVFGILDVKKTMQFLKENSVPVPVDSPSNNNIFTPKATEEKPKKISRFMEIEGGIHYSNLALVDLETKEAVKVKIRRRKDPLTKQTIKERVFTKYNNEERIIPYPKPFEREKSKIREGLYDTSSEVANLRTFFPDISKPVIPFDCIL